MGKMLTWIRHRASAQRGVETIEYIAIGAVVAALLGATVAVVDSWGGYQIGAAVVRTTQCWLSSLNDAIDCPELEEVAEAPPQSLPTPLPTPCPYLVCEPPPQPEPDVPERTFRGPETPEPLSPLLDKLGLIAEAAGGEIQEWIEQFREFLKRLPEEERGAVLAGLLPFLLLLLLLGVTLTFGGLATLLGAAGLLAAAVAGWLYGQGHSGESFSYLGAVISGLAAWVLAFLGLEGLGRLALALGERRTRKPPGLARLAPQEPPPGLLDKLLALVGGLAIATPGIPDEVLVLLVVLAFGGSYFITSRGTNYSLSLPSSHTAQERQIAANNSLAAEVETFRADAGNRQIQAVEQALAGETATIPPGYDPNDPENPWKTRDRKPATGAARFLPPEVAKFFHGNVHMIRLQSPVEVYRYWGGTLSRQTSNWWTTANTMKRIEAIGRAWARSVLDLPAHNTAQNLGRCTIKAGTVIFMGHIRGGARWATQIWIQDYQNSVIC